jgi:Copper type II ascorbate-dependent monooxygenase, C-terminal domain
VRQQPYQILPGDSFSTTCFFTTSENATFGEASSNEMCQILLLYYPAQRILNTAPWTCIYDIPFPPCSSTLSTSMVVATSDASSMTSSSGRTYLERTFGYSSGGQCMDQGINTPYTVQTTSSAGRSFTAMILWWWFTSYFVLPIFARIPI